jgi:PAS domain S-box-containing protein
MKPGLLSEPDPWRCATGRLPGAAAALLAAATARAQATPAGPSIAPQLSDLFWALFLLATFVLVGLIWVGIIRRNGWQQTQRVRQREAALEEHYRELFENAHDIIFTHDLSGQLTSLNRAGERILGYTRQEAAGLNLSDLVAPGHRAVFRETLNGLATGPGNAHCELEMRAKDGQRVMLRLNLSVQQLSGTRRIQGIAWDITERTLAEEALQKSEQRLRRSLQERVQLGRDLHDGIIQSIYAIGLGLQECRNLIQRDPAQAQTRLARSISDLNSVIRDVRNFIVGLEPEALKGREFTTALQSLVDITGQAHAAQCRFEIDTQAAGSLDARQAMHLLQIAREAMSNSLRHAGARHTVISLQRQNGSVRLEVRDDGAGFDSAAGSAAGHGLRNIAARAAELGARNEVVSAPGSGTRVVIEIPAHRLYEHA